LRNTLTCIIFIKFPKMKEHEIEFLNNELREKSLWRSLYWLIFIVQWDM